MKYIFEIKADLTIYIKLNQVLAKKRKLDEQKEHEKINITFNQKKSYCNLNNNNNQYISFENKYLDSSIKSDSEQQQFKEKEKEIKMEYFNVNNDEDFKM